MRKNLSKKNIVVIGGGTGVFVVLSSLKNYPCHLSAIITMADSGGSSGRLREEFGILPPGDVRKALVALSRSDNRILSEVFNYRFPGERFQMGVGLDGHNLGNLFLTALEQISGSFKKAVEEAGKILNIKGRVIPVTLNQTHLVAELENGAIIYGETHIDIPKHNPRLRIKKIWLQPAAKVNPDAKKAIETADLIVIGPGDLYTSVLPNLLVKGLKTAIQKSRAKKLYIVNIMTKYGETNHFQASNFVAEIEKYLGRGALSHVLVNIERPDAKRLKKYREEKAEFVEFDGESLKNFPYKIIKAKILRPRGLLRHDFCKLARVLWNLVFS